MLKNNLITSIVYSKQEDIVSEIFQIHLDFKVQDLSNEFVDYYLATCVNDDKKYFAIVFKQNFNIPLNKLNILINLYSKNLICPIKYEVTCLSTTKIHHMVAIVEQYDYKNSLSKIIQEHGGFKIEPFKLLLEDLLKIIGITTEYKLCCGNINPDNIIYHNGCFVLREIFISPPNFYQQEAFIPPELIECIPYGRIGEAAEEDIYALGVTLFYALSGKKIWFENFDSIKNYNIARLEKNTFNLLMDYSKKEYIFSYDIKILLNNILCHSPHDRWKIENIINWTTYKNKHLIDFNEKEKDSFILFHNIACYNMKQLAYCFYDNWQLATQFIHDNRTLKNISKIFIKDEVKKIKDEKNIFSTFADLLGNTREIDLNRRLSKILSKMDPDGPIRLENFAISLFSIPELAFYSNQKDKNFWIPNFYKIIENKFEGLYCNNDVNSDYFNQIEIVKNWLYINNNHWIIKLCYFFNPTIQCLSPLVINEYIITVPQLICFLETIADKSPEKLLIDTHILLFIEVRLSIRNYLFYAEKENILASEEVLILFILISVQNTYPDINIENLNTWIVNKIIILLQKYLHNVPLKKILEEQILSASKQNNLSEIFNIVSNKTLFKNDLNAYKNACKDVEYLDAKILKLSNKNQNMSKGLFIGQTFTVLVSYLLCLLVIITLLI